jgi:hypothetical protein
MEARPRKRKRNKKLPSPEDDPLWNLFGVWGRVLIVFANIGFMLYFGSLLFGWSMFKFLMHVSGSGWLLLFLRPNYSPFLSVKWCKSGLSLQQLEELKGMVVRKLESEGNGGAASPASSYVPSERRSRLRGSLGIVGDFLTRVVKGK